MTDHVTRRPWLPSRWFVRLAWRMHRGLYRVTGGRRGLWRPSGRRWGAMRLTTTGRRTGRERSVILGYIEDGPNLVTMAMNGWAEPEPAWWLNLLDRPAAVVELVDGRRTVTGRAAEGEERSRLWARLRELDPKLDAFAARRTGETAVVVLEPAQGVPPDPAGLRATAAWRQSNSVDCRLSPQVVDAIRLAYLRECNVAC